MKRLVVKIDIDKPIESCRECYYCHPMMYEESSDLGYVCDSDELISTGDEFNWVTRHTEYRAKERFPSWCPLEAQNKG